MQKLTPADQQLHSQKWQPPHLDGGGQGQSEQQRKQAIFDKAREEGFQTGLQQAEQSFQAQQASFDALSETLKNQSVISPEIIEDQQKVLEDCVSLAVSMCETLMAQELNVSRVDIMQVLLKYWQDQQSPDGNIHVLVHAHDLQQLQQHPAWPKIEHLCQFSVHPEISAGNMLLESKTQTVDLSIASRFNALVEGLYGNIQNPLNAQD